MTNDVIAHIHELVAHPVLDVLGEWVFCRNTKVATTSICEGVLGDRCIGKLRCREGWDSVWKHIIVPRIDGLVLFTFVRNPWERALSAFLHCRASSNRRAEYRIDKGWEFGSYVKRVVKTLGFPDNMHFAPQYDTFCYNGEPIPGMFVGRFENLAEDWKKVANRLGVTATLPTLGASEHKHYTEYYDEETKEIVGEVYAPEIKALGYEFGDTI